MAQGTTYRLNRAVGPLCLLLALAAIAHAKSSSPRWSPEAFPNPQRDVGACGRHGVKSNICDPDGVLSYDGGNLIEGTINAIRNGEEPYKTSPCGDEGPAGFQVAVAVMRRMYIETYEDAAVTAARFARSLHSRWGVGSAACSNGVLLLLSTSDRQVYISTGSGAEARLPRAKLARIMDNMKPALRDRRFDAAVLEAVHEIGLGVSGEDVPGEGGAGVFLFFCAIVAGMFGWGWWSNRRQMRRYQTCQTRLQALMRDQAAMRRGAFASTSCPICLDDFEDDAAAARRAAAGPSGSGGDPAAAAAAAAAARAGAAGSTTSAAAAGEASKSGGAEAPSDTTPLLSSRNEAAAASAGTRTKRPLALRCGHTFCAPCISEWLKNHTNCPVCRRDIDAPDSDDAARSPPPRPPCGAGVDAGMYPDIGMGGPMGGMGMGMGMGYPGHMGMGMGMGYGPGYMRMRTRRDVWLPELMFRTQRLRLLYPDLVSDSMAAQLMDDLEQDREITPAAFASFEAHHPARDPVRRAEIRESGRTGASASFGGGRGDGGGAGSSW